MVRRRPPFSHLIAEEWNVVLVQILENSLFQNIIDQLAFDMSQHLKCMKWKMIIILSFPFFKFTIHTWTESWTSFSWTVLKFQMVVPKQLPLLQENSLFDLLDYLLPCPLNDIDCCFFLNRKVQNKVSLKTANQHEIDTPTDCANICNISDEFLTFCNNWSETS